jgi:hypothetical protein
LRRRGIRSNRRSDHLRVCYCASRQKAGRAFERFPAAPPVLEPDGGTAAILFRKDRVRCVHGREQLLEHRLMAGSPSRRFVTRCCHSAMFLDFTRGQWFSMYRRRFPTEAPEIEMRVMTRDRRAGVALRGDVPNYLGYSVRFMMKLLPARIAMGFDLQILMVGGGRGDGGVRRR